MSRPAPKLNDINRPFWEGCNDDRLMIQRCAAESCRRYVFYPRVCCPSCGGGTLDWHQASGKARVLTFTIVHHPLNEALRADTPFVFAAVALEEGPTLYTRLEVDPGATDDLLDRPLIVSFRADQLPDQKIPFFRVQG